jgi:ribose 5-phosphate isomerase B
MSMAANRNPKIRAGLCKDVETAKLTRQHNDANVLCLGARVTDINSIESIVDAFLETEFEGGRHEKRIKKF